MKNAEKQGYRERLGDSAEDLRRFEMLDASAEAVAKEVYAAALLHKDNSLGLYGAIFYAAMMVLVKAERLAQPKTAREKRERERQIAFIKKVLASDMIRRGVHNEKTA